MSRIVVNRDLPPLQEVLAHFLGFPKDKTQKQVMIDELAATAKSLIANEPRPFYSMREVADFFHATLGTTSLVYKALERQGLINRIRSSRTMLVGSAVSSRDRVRGVVGLPTSLKALVALPYTRVLSTEIEARLRHLGYVADVIFHTEAEKEPEFTRRLLKHRLDAIVLHTPGKGGHGILTIRDQGVRVLVIQRKLTCVDLPAIIYLQDHVPAYRKMAARWQEIGIRKVWLWNSPGSACDKREIPDFRDHFKDIEVEVINDHPHELLQRIRLRKRKFDTAVAFIDMEKYQLCNIEPVIIEKISQVARIGFCGGNIYAPYLQNRGILVDIVDYNPVEIAAQLTTDIGQMAVLPDGVRRTFLAEYFDQVRL